MSETDYVERPCSECGESTYNPDLCRDCDIARGLDQMQCSECKRMRYRKDGPRALGEFAAYLWGDDCACDPKPPSVYEFNRQPTTGERKL